MNLQRRLQPFVNMLVVLVLLFSPLGSAYASPAPSSPSEPVIAVPATVTIAGSLNTEMGCAGDWDPSCALAFLTYDAADDVWQGNWSLPLAGAYAYKAVLDANWSTAYPGSDVPVTVAADGVVRFYYDDKTHYVADSINKTVITFAGNFQDELGCPGDWQPDCLRSMGEDMSGGGTYTFSTTALPVGNYNVKAAINEGWAESYGDGGGPNDIPFAVTRRRSRPWP